MDLRNRFDFNRHGLGYTAPSTLPKGKNWDYQENKECQYNVLISHLWQKKHKVVMKVKPFSRGNNVMIAFGLINEPQSPCQENSFGIENVGK